MISIYSYDIRISTMNLVVGLCVLLSCHVYTLLLHIPKRPGMDMRPLPYDQTSISTIAEYIRKKELLDLLMNPTVSVHSKVYLLESASLKPFDKSAIQEANLLNGGLLDKWNAESI